MSDEQTHTGGNESVSPIMQGSCACVSDAGTATYFGILNVSFLNFF